jgi:antirestriction protein
MCNDTTPRIYVACLAAYNNGKLHGIWIDCNQDADGIWKEINAMLSSSPESDAEEWAIHDYENWQGLLIGENESIECIAEIAELLQEHGKAFAVYCNYHNSDANAKDSQDCYVEKYESEEEFAYGFWEELGIVEQLEKLGVYSFYIDWEAVARDLFINSYFSVETGYKEVYVFSRC